MTTHEMYQAMETISKAVSNYTAYEPSTGLLVATFCCLKDAVLFCKHCKYEDLGDGLEVRDHSGEVIYKKKGRTPTQVYMKGMDGFPNPVVGVFDDLDEARAYTKRMNDFYQSKKFYIRTLAKPQDMDMTLEEFMNRGRKHDEP